MSDQPMTPHRGFSAKARGVLLGDDDRSTGAQSPGVMVDEPESSVIAPHRGFNTKAREMLIGDNDIHLSGMPMKSSSDFDLRKKLRSCTLRRRTSNNTNDTSPKSVSSTQSVNDPRQSANDSRHDSQRNEKAAFDVIGEVPMVKQHKRLGQIGKTKSCVEFKSIDKRLIKTFQEENIIKMPSIDSDIDSIIATRSDFEVSIDNLDNISKADLYTADEARKKEVKNWLDKSHT